MVKKKSKPALPPFGDNSALEMKQAKRNVKLLFAAGVMLLVFILLYFPVILPFIKQTYARFNTGLSVDAVISARQASEPSYDATRSARISKLVEAGVIETDIPAYSRKTDTCLLAGQQQGWVTNNWAQYCSFTYLDLLETTLPRNELIEKINAAPESDLLFGSADNWPKTTGCDTLYRLSSGTVVSHLDGSRGNNLECQLSLANATGVSPEHFALKVIRDFTIQEVDRSKSYIQIESKPMYFNHKIGCIKEFMSCSSPIESPVSGF